MAIRSGYNDTMKGIPKRSKMALTRPRLATPTRGVSGLSRGCDLCRQGKWSCLFVHLVCTADCFFCPRSRTGGPELFTFERKFRDAHEFADYVQANGIKGVSFSGGEPLLKADVVCKFLRTLKRRFGSRLYTWLYTNGDLASITVLRRLAKAGLDEIRYNIAAREYGTERLRLALGIIPHVTVEIPAIPEDRERLRHAIRELDALGIKHLNLHQLYGTQDNLPAFVKRGYSFLREPRNPVLESELAALRAIKFARDQGLHLSIRYCSSSYKERVHGWAFRKLMFGKFSYPSTLELTESAYLRSLSVLVTTGSEAAKVRARLMTRDPRRTRWKEAVRGRKFDIAHEFCAGLLDLPVRFEIRYWTISPRAGGEPALSPAFRSRNMDTRLMRRFLKTYCGSEVKSRSPAIHPAFAALNPFERTETALTAAQRA